MKDFLQAIFKNVKGEFGELEKERAETCSKCAELIDSNYSEIVNSVMIDVKGKACNLCNCPISTKIFAKEQKNICQKWLK